jgi:DNA polymerase III alpha subunit
VEAYQGAYLKTRYPMEFLAAVLSSRRGFYAPIVYVLEALRCGAKFLPPDVNLSEPRFAVRGNTIRLPLDQVKGLTKGTLERLYSARPFRDAGDFYRRVRPCRAEWTALLRVGALDSFDEPRGRIFWRLCRLEATTGSASLIEPDPGLATPRSPQPAAQARAEHELLGFPISCHPLDYFGPGIDWDRYVKAVDLRRAPQRYFDQQIEVCGLIVADRIHPTDRGSMKFLTLADHTGFVEVSLFAGAYQRFGHLTTHPVVAVTAHVDPFDNRKGCALTGMGVEVALPSKVLQLA